MSDKSDYQPPESLAKRVGDFFQYGDFERGFLKTLPVQVQAEASREAAQQTKPLSTTKESGDPDSRAYAEELHKTSPAYQFPERCGG